MAITVSIIGSFRRHYQPVLEAWRVFTQAGWSVQSPAGSPVTEESKGELFVRFESDEPDWDDPFVQTIALHRILRSEVTYAVIPDGYVGRTTAYEIGRLIQAGRPLYFSAMPHDLPIIVGKAFVVTPEELRSRLTQESPSWLYRDGNSDHNQLERDLVDGRYCDL